MYAPCDEAIGTSMSSAAQLTIADRYARPVASVTIAPAARTAPTADRVLSAIGLSVLPNRTVNIQRYQFVAHFIATIPAKILTSLVRRACPNNQSPSALRLIPSRTKVHQTLRKGRTMKSPRRIPPRMIIWLLILPIVIYVLITALRERQLAAISSLNPTFQCRTDVENSRQPHSSPVLPPPSRSRQECH